MNVYGKAALFLGGVLFGSAGFSLLGSQDAKKVYTHTTAAVLRCKDHVMRAVETVQENCSDVLEDAKAINEAREQAADAATVEDAPEAETEETE